MIQALKSFSVRSLTVKGFKGFADETTFSFDDMNTITGHNGQGKPVSRTPSPLPSPASPFMAGPNSTTYIARTPEIFWWIWSLQTRPAQCGGSPASA